MQKIFNWPVDNKGKISRRSFLSTCGACTACFAASAYASLNTLSSCKPKEKIRIRIIYSLHTEIQDRPDWPNIGFDFRPVINEINQALSNNLPNFEFLPAMATGEEEAEKILAQDASEKIDGYLVGCIGNKQGYLGEDYPEYGSYPGIGGKLYRQGLIKMNEFVTHCGRDRIPIIWFQDTTGIDVGDIAEKAELLGLGMSLIYSIQQTDVPMMLLLLRKGSAAAHYVMGGPTANRHNAFTLGIPTTEIYVMHGETAAAASFSRRQVKEKDAGNPLDPVIDKMNKMAQEYYDNSRPLYCAQKGLVDEISTMGDIREYLAAFSGAVYQNTTSVCPQHQMLVPRLIRG